MKSALYLLSVVILASFVLVASAGADVPFGPLKWSQPIYKIGADAAGVPIYWGWDELSFIGPNGGGPQVADDWQCRNGLPVTDIHWWGSYIGWREPVPHPAGPIGFWFGIYTDVPAPAAGGFSHPGDLLWEYRTTDYIEKFVGYDVMDPAGPPIESTFQYNVFLPRTAWFFQPGSDAILWLSIRAIEPAGAFQEWGWKTRPHFFQDDAVRATTAGGWQPIFGPDGHSWGMSFELSTVPEPGSLAAFGTGLVGLLGLAFRRKR